MSFELVRVDESHLDDWAFVVRSVYGRASETTEFPFEPREAKYLVIREGKPVSACSTYSYDIVRGSSTLNCAGIAAVGTLAGERRTGAGHFLMSSVVKDCAERGFDISALYPYRETYYRRFGYATCGWRYQIKCPQARIPKVESPLSVRQLQMDELMLLNDTYETFIRSRSGSPLRTENDWQHRMGKRKPYVFAFGDPVEAYIWATHDDFWGDVQVGEMAWKSAAGYRACLSLIGSIAANMSTVTWSEPPDSPMITSYLDQGIEVTISRPTMFRILNVENTFQKLTPGKEGTFEFEVRDRLVSSNDGQWKVSSDHSGTAVSRGSKPDFSLEIEELSQALMGQPSLFRLGQSERIKIIDSDGFKRASEALDELPVVMMEFF